jgi:hypothetical protein
MKQTVLLLVLIAAVGLGCRFLGGSGDSGGTSGGAGGGLSGGSDPKGDLVAASKKFVDLKSFSAKMQGKGITNGVENDIKQQVDYVAPDRYHVIYQAGVAAGMELVFIGGDMFMKPAGGNWSKSPGGGAAMPTLRDSFTEEGLKSLSDAKYEGEETINGKTALVYSYKNVTPKGDFPFTAKMYVNKSTGVPLRVFAQYSNGVLKEMTIDYDVDSPVTIEAPAT